MLVKITSLVFFLSIFISLPPAHSAVFNVSSGDVTGLIAAINAANANGEENTINLEAGTYTLTSVVSGTMPTTSGLPVISSTMTINGESAETTIVERDAAAPLFGIFFNAGNLTINALTVRGAQSFVGFRGGGIRNDGELTIIRSIIDRNGVTAGLGEGGGIRNFGTLTLSHTLLTNNFALDGGAILNSGTANISRSSVINNSAIGGGGIFNEAAGTMTIQNSTISRNIRGGGVSNGCELVIQNSSIVNNSEGFGAGGAGIRNFGALRIINATVAGNRSGPVRGGGIRNGGVAELQNSILALNVGLEEPSDCIGPIISLGNNIIGDLTDCIITLQGSDLTGDPGLGAFIDDGAPGNGRLPLLATSRAIDAGNDTACPATDQLETPRRGRCDIGAVEFYPVVNDLVALANVKTDFDPTPVPNGPAGTFRVIAEFTNTGTQPIGHRFAEVIELAEGNLLLNADRGAGGVGARLTSVDSTSKLLLPGATETVEFIIGLLKQEPFTFFVNLLGDPEISNTSVTHLGKR